MTSPQNKRQKLDEILGWRLSRTSATATAEAALEETLFHRLGHLQHLNKPLLLRSDNGLVFSLERYTMRLSRPMDSARSSFCPIPRHIMDLWSGSVDR